MIRWYDYIIAIIAADMMQTFLFAGYSAETVWGSILYGTLAGVVFLLWDKDYIKFRVKQESKS